MEHTVDRRTGFVNGLLLGGFLIGVFGIYGTIVLFVCVFFTSPYFD